MMSSVYLRAIRVHFVQMGTYQHAIRSLLANTASLPGSIIGSSLVTQRMLFTCWFVVFVGYKPSSPSLDFRSISQMQNFRIIVNVKLWLSTCMSIPNFSECIRFTTRTIQKSEGLWKKDLYSVFDLLLIGINNWNLCWYAAWLLPFIITCNEF